MPRIRTTWRRRRHDSRLAHDANELRRTSDRIEAIGARVCSAAVLLAVPFVVLLAIGTFQRASVEAEHEASKLHRTEAVTLEDAPSGQGPMGARLLEASVPARWTAPNGAGRQGKVPVPVGTQAGESVPVWTTATGDLEAAPVSRSWLLMDAFGLAVGNILVIAAAAYGCRRLLRQVVDQRRLRAWDIDWARLDEHH